MASNAKGSSVCGSAPFKEYSTNTLDFLTSDKALASLKSQFETAGHKVYEGANYDFIVTKWGMSRYCPDIGSLRRFARALGVQHG